MLRARRLLACLLLTPVLACGRTELAEPSLDQLANDPGLCDVRFSPVSHLLEINGQAEALALREDVAIVGGRWGESALIAEVHMPGPVDGPGLLANVLRPSPSGCDVSSAASVTLDDHGRVLFSGECTADAQESRTVVARLYRGGQLDLTFGEDGIVLLDMDRNVPERVSRVFSTAIGQVRVLAQLDPGPADFAVAGLTSDGLIQKSYGSGGVTPLRASNVDTSLFVPIPGFDALMQPGDNIVVVGRRWSDNWVPYVTRLSFRGVPDGDFRSFDGPRSAIPQSYTAVARAPEGGLYIVGSASARVLLARTHDDGTPDLRFSEDGLREVNLIERVDVTDVAVDRSGGALILGTRRQEGTLPAAVLLHIDRFGTLDAEFGTHGLLELGDGATEERAVALACDASGRLVTVTNTPTLVRIRRFGLRQR